MHLLCITMYWTSINTFKLLLFTPTIIQDKDIYLNTNIPDGNNALYSLFSDAKFNINIAANTNTKIFTGPHCHHLPFFFILIPSWLGCCCCPVPSLFPPWRLPSVSGSFFFVLLDAMLHLVVPSSTVLLYLTPSILGFNPFLIQNGCKKWRWFQFMVERVFK